MMSMKCCINIVIFISQSTNDIYCILVMSRIPLNFSISMYYIFQSRLKYKFDLGWVCWCYLEIHNFIFHARISDINPTHLIHAFLQQIGWSYPKGGVECVGLISDILHVKLVLFFETTAGTHGVIHKIQISKLIDCYDNDNTQIYYIFHEGIYKSNCLMLYIVPMMTRSWQIQ